MRVGMAVMPTHYRFWHSHRDQRHLRRRRDRGASAIGLDADGDQRALGFAGTQAAGLNTFFESGDMTKSIHPARPRCNGISAPARAGSAPPVRPTILEHPEGYLNGLLGRAETGRPDAGLGTTWEILQNGFKFSLPFSPATRRSRPRSQ